MAKFLTYSFLKPEGTAVKNSPFSGPSAFTGSTGGSQAPDAGQMSRMQGLMGQLAGKMGGGPMAPGGPVAPGPMMGGGTGAPGGMPGLGQMPMGSMDMNRMAGAAGMPQMPGGAGGGDMLTTLRKLFANQPGAGATPGLFGA